MSEHVELRAGAYADSVALLQVSRDVAGVPGVAAAQVAMATPLNLDVLAQMGFTLPQSTPNDMVVAIRLDDESALDAALAAVDTALSRGRERRSGADEAEPHRTTRTALAEPGEPATLVLVSTPGDAAAVEAVDALDAGCDVMLFSDNVPLEQEIALKDAADARDLLVMGPDCGTAVVDGLGVGFANATTPGPVGLVAASGTGCQQVLALLDHAGVGVTWALGVGGRDLSAEVAGRSTRTALARLDADPTVELVVLVSKPPAPEVAEEVTALTAAMDTPVVTALLGAGRPDLTAATEDVLRALGRDVPRWPVIGPAKPLRPAPGPLRGWFVGGTLCSEAAVIAEEALGTPQEMVDFGADELTQGRAHPMIDPTLRLDRIDAVADGVLLLDVVLGHGAEPDPAARLAPAVRGATERGVPVVVSCVGTAGDPQGLVRTIRALVEAGAEVHLSNAGAARRAAELVGGPQ